MSLYLSIMAYHVAGWVGEWVALQMQCSDCASTYTDTGTYRYKQTEIANHDANYTSHPHYNNTMPKYLHPPTPRQIRIRLCPISPLHLLTTTATSTQSTPNGAVGKGQVEGVSIPRTSRSGEWSSYRSSGTRLRSWMGTISWVAMVLVELGGGDGKKTVFFIPGRNFIITSEGGRDCKVSTGIGYGTGTFQCGEPTYHHSGNCGLRHW